MKNLIVDFRIHNEEKKYLISLGYNLLICPPSNLLYEAVCGHPDMLMHISGNSIIVHKDMNSEFIQDLDLLNYKVYKSNSTLQKLYPYNIFSIH